jgi:hypothetical protein
MQAEWSRGLACMSTAALERKYLVCTSITRWPSNMLYSKQQNSTIQWLKSLSKYIEDIGLENVKHDYHMTQLSDSHLSLGKLLISEIILSPISTFLPKYEVCSTREDVAKAHAKARSRRESLSWSTVILQPIISPSLLRQPFSHHQPAQDLTSGCLNTGANMLVTGAWSDSL